MISSVVERFVHIEDVSSSNLLSPTILSLEDQVPLPAPANGITLARGPARLAMILKTGQDTPPGHHAPPPVAGRRNDGLQSRAVRR